MNDPNGQKAYAWVLSDTPGDDVFQGIGDADYVGYQNAKHGVTVDLSLTGPQDTGSGRDTFIGIENLSGSDYADVLRGDDGKNQIEGGRGNDVIDGRGGDDLLVGGDGDDEIHGGAGNDRILGGPGHNRLFGDAGDDTFLSNGDGDVIDGGEGFDSFQLFSDGPLTTPLTIDLRRTDAQEIQPGVHVTLISIERLEGSKYADKFIGNDADNVFAGGGGDDDLDGGAGIDRVIFYGNRRDFTIAIKNGVWTVTNTGAYPGVATLHNIEFIDFTDGGMMVGDGVSLAVANVLRLNGAAATTLDVDISGRMALGQLTPAGAVSEIVAKAINTTSVATMAYQFFTGKIPGQAGIDYLVSPTGPNANNLNSAYYQSFNLENRYINFAVNLGKLGEGKDAFAATYGALSLFDATREAYKTIFGGAPTDDKIHALIDSRTDYFASYGGDGANGIGTKAAMVGWLLAEAEKADIGVMAKSNDVWLSHLAQDATPQFAVNLLDPTGPYFSWAFLYDGK